MSNSKSHADLLFEQYLLSQCMRDFEYEKDWKMDGITTHPDYSVVHEGSTYIFEVKELDPKTPFSGFSFSDPYKNIRAKIKKVGYRNQLKPFKGRFPCCLVLWSNDDPRQLLDPFRMGGAMYGDIGFRVYFDSETGESVGKDSEVVFNTRGKMFTPGNKQTQNTTISALISLSVYPTGQLWETLNGQIDSTELRKMNLFQTNDTNLVVPGVSIWENEFAELPFPREIFNGPFDHRYIVEGGYFKPHKMGKAWEIIQSMKTVGAGA